MSRRSATVPSLIAASWRAAALAALAAASTGCAAAPDAEDVVLDGPEPTDDLAEGVTTGTVAQAAANSCATSSVKPLSLQIIAEGNCIKPGAYAKVPSRPNLSFGSSAFRYLEAPAKNRLVAALDANPGKSLSVNSMLRTIAQQYLLYRWYKTGRCGIGLAAYPGSSNHETGLAFDTNQYSSWKSPLAARGFKWFGSGDPYHFDYVGTGAVSYKGLDVRAFQRLWNRNHPGDKISVDGSWGPQTEARMKKAPAGGFAKGAVCGSGSQDAETDVAMEEESSLELAKAAAVAATQEDHDHPVLSASDAELGEARTECDACVESICDVDPFCCGDQWDAACVAHTEAECQTQCALEPVSFEGDALEPLDIDE
jgi:hypothetical protein